LDVEVWDRGVARIAARQVAHSAYHAYKNASCTHPESLPTDERAQPLEVLPQGDRLLQQADARRSRSPFALESLCLGPPTRFGYL